MPAITGSTWRFGVYGQESFQRRWLIAETWHCTDPAPSFSESTGVAVGYIPFISAPFQARPFLAVGGRNLIQQLYPIMQYLVPMDWSVNGVASRLNQHAPEACFRLQRVGAGGSPPKLGRIYFPILDDSLFTDLPHRRHVDATTLQGYLNAGLNSFPTEFTTFGGNTWTNCSINRVTNTFTRVMTRTILPSTMRRWHRFRRYTPSSISDANKWQPEEWNRH